MIYKVRSPTWFFRGGCASIEKRRKVLLCNPWHIVCRAAKMAGRPAREAALSMIVVVNTECLDTLMREDAVRAPFYPFV